MQSSPVTSAWPIGAISAALMVGVTISTLLLALLVPWFRDRLWNVLTSKPHGEARFDREWRASAERQPEWERVHLERVLSAEIGEWREARFIAERNGDALRAVSASLEAQARLVSEMPPAMQELGGTVRTLTKAVESLHDDVREQRRQHDETREDVAHMRGVLDTQYDGPDRRVMGRGRRRSDVEGDDR